MADSAAAKRPPRDRRYQARAVSRWHRTNVAGLTPERLASILRRAERGELEEWADVVESMLRTDAHLRSVWETLLRGVVSAELVWEPGPHAPGQADAAQKAADFMQAATERVDALEDGLLHLLHGGAGMGLGVAEQVWVRAQGAWWVRRWVPVSPRDTDYDDDWTPRVRTYHANAFGGQRGWIRLDAEPEAWLWHVPGSPGLTPNVAGILMSVVWPWLFKKWAILFQQTGLERFADPLFIGKVQPNSEDGAREALFEALDQLSAGHIGVMEEGNELEVVQAAGTTGEPWREAIGQYNDEMTKGLLGSTLNVEVGSTGGNRALGESQAEQTILPRQRAMADSLSRALVHRWARPALGFNAHLFGGVPPMPRATFRLEQEEPPVIEELHVNSGVVRRDELRASAGLEPEGGAWGEAFVKPLAKSRPDRPPEVGASGDPFPEARRRRASTPRQMTLPMPPATSRTCSPSTSMVSNVPFAPSDDPEP